jgi:trk system potassium uptake protein
MRKEAVIRHLGLVLNFNALFLLISAAISLYYHEESLIPLAFTAFICLSFGTFTLLFVPVIPDLRFTEAISVVVLGWLLTCLVGALPYIMYGGEFSLADAWFESVSGFTTTGSTILSDIEALPKGLLFWRSSTHLIGGLGIIIFILLVLPRSKGARFMLFNTEMSDLSRYGFNLPARKAIWALAYVYIGLTVIETLLLNVFGMSVFDALAHSFATVATGGFSTKNLSVAAFDSVSIEVTITVFMVLSGIHFGLIYGAVTGRRTNIFRSRVVRAYLLAMLAGIALVTLKLKLEGVYDWGPALRYASFQVASVGTTTGFATADTAGWPFFTILILMYFTIQCAMVGSTSGGLKFDRVYLMFKSLSKQVRIFQHPRAVIAIKMDNKLVADDLERQTLLFILFYILIFLATTVLLSWMDIDTITAFSASITTLGNVGPGFGHVSSMGNFGALPEAAKWLLSLNMLLGRLEIYNILAFLLILRGRVR